jgi:hypothetical protein
MVCSGMENRIGQLGNGERHWLAWEGFLEAKGGRRRHKGAKGCTWGQKGTLPMKLASARNWLAQGIGQLGLGEQNWLAWDYRLELASSGSENGIG